jgi:uncharacterized membrane protein YkvA (DUF1232 family)
MLTPHGGNQMASFTPAQVAAALDTKAGHLGLKDLERVVAGGDAVRQMLLGFPKEHALAGRQAELLLDLLGAGTAPIESRKQAAGALIYLGAPIDLVPDDDEDGYSDDAAVIQLAVTRTEEALRVHCVERGLDFDEYLAS